MRSRILGIVLGLALVFSALAGTGCVMRRPNHAIALGINAAVVVAGALTFRAGRAKEMCAGECRADSNVLAAGFGMMAVGAMGALITSLLYLSEPAHPPPSKKRRHTEDAEAPMIPFPRR
jgi:hypothetical protein